MRYPRSWWVWPLRILVLWVAFGFLAANAAAQSPTMDEQNHIARGYALLRTGDARLSVEHPPLINVLEALPLSRDLAIPLDDWSWQVGEWYQFADLFLWHLNADADRLVYLARLPIVALTMLLMVLASRWAQQLWGGRSGMLTLCLVALDPNLLAHGSLATTDTGVAVTTIVAAYSLWHLARSPSWRRILLSGLAVGAMLASKLSAVAFWGIYGVLFALGAGVARGAQLGPRSSVWRCLLKSGLCYALVTGVAVTFLWGSYAFGSAPVIAEGHAVPLGSYLSGIRSLFTSLQGGRPSYLFGETRLAGWPLYFPITFAVKTPLPVLALVGVAAAATCYGKRWRSSLLLLIPVGAYGASVLLSSLNLGYRHLLPVLPLLYVWVGQCAVAVPKRPQLRVAAMLLTALLALESLWIAPHFLAYFNALGGGPSQGWRVVADSNIDWGQDLKRLKRYLDEESLGAIKLSWFGSAPPEAYGIAYEPLPGLPHHFDLWFEPPSFNEQQPEPGVYVISVSNLVELPLDRKHFFAYFREREPDARIGYSVYVYKVGDVD